MRTHTNDRLKGTLDLLVLKTLASQGRMHGYGITLRIEQISENVLRLEEGSLYPALHRMTQAGWLKSEWGASESNRRARDYSALGCTFGKLFPSAPRDKSRSDGRATRRITSGPALRRLGVDFRSCHLTPVSSRSFGNQPSFSASS